MHTKSKAYLVGGGIVSLTAAAFMVRDGSFPGENISILKAASLLGGSLEVPSLQGLDIPCAAAEC
jgi:oleate hydratase